MYLITQWHAVNICLMQSQSKEDLLRFWNNITTQYCHNGSCPKRRAVLLSGVTLKSPHPMKSHCKGIVSTAVIQKEVVLLACIPVRLLLHVFFLIKPTTHYRLEQNPWLGEVLSQQLLFFFPSVFFFSFCMHVRTGESIANEKLVKLCQGSVRLCLRLPLSSKLTSS